MFVAPALAGLGSVIPVLEALRPVLVGPVEVAARLIPDAQTAPNRFVALLYRSGLSVGWLAALGVNGVCYAILGGIVHWMLGLVRREGTGAAG